MIQRKGFTIEVDLPAVRIYTLDTLHVQISSYYSVDEALEAGYAWIKDHLLVSFERLKIHRVYEGVRWEGLYYNNDPEETFHVFTTDELFLLSTWANFCRATLDFFERRFGPISRSDLTGAPLLRITKEEDPQKKSTLYGLEAKVREMWVGMETPARDDLLSESINGLENLRAALIMAYHLRQNER